MATLIQFDRQPFIDPLNKKNENLIQLKAKYFDYIDFTNSSVLRNNRIAGKILSYVWLFTNENVNQRDYDREYKAFADTILKKTIVNREVYDFAVELLIDFFRGINRDHLVDYVSEQYNPALSYDIPEQNELFANRINNIKRLALGKTAPEIETIDITGTVIKLSEIEAERTVLLFWSGSCNQCYKLITELKKISNQNQFEVLAISIDEEPASWSLIIDELELDWINSIEPDGIMSKPAHDYDIGETPVMFLLDKDKRIAAKPRNISELQKALIQQ